MKETIVIGIGNPLMSDEGIGIEVVRIAGERAGDLPDVEFIDGGTSAMTIVHAIAGRKQAVLIDCAKMGEAPGTMRRFSPEEVESLKSLPGLSLHEGDLMTFLQLSRDLGEYPDRVVIFGIEPAVIEPTQALSPEIEARLDEYVTAVLAELDPS